MTGRGHRGFAFPPEETRALILETLPEQPASHGEPPRPEFLYVPASHARAFHPDTLLVVGMQGTGKSTGWAALQAPLQRALIAPGMGVSTLISPGFGPKLQPDDYPSPETFLQLLATHKARDIWWTLIAWHVTGENAGPLPKSPAGWHERVEWMTTHRQESERALYEADQQLVRHEQRHIVIFDALSRITDDWDTQRQLLRGLLEALLQSRAFGAIRAKAFVRPDMLEDPQVRQFPDATKVLTSRVNLDWSTADLLGLLWQHLGNGVTHGAAFRTHCEQEFGIKWKRELSGWRVPAELRRNEELQRSVFHAMTGPYMGSIPITGRPSTWLFNRLSDAHLKIVPRSFLSAIRAAAASDLNEGKPFALSSEALKAGVKRASMVRLQELGESAHWLDTVMHPLRDLVIPCEFGDIEARWMQEHVLDTLKRERNWSLPKRFEQGHKGILEDLMELGVFEQMPDDGRINMPDIYRLGFGLKRKGGFRPVR